MVQHNSDWVFGLVNQIFEHALAQGTYNIDRGDIIPIYLIWYGMICLH